MKQFGMARTIGRTLTSATIRKKSQKKGVWVFSLKGDRGVVELNLTTGEVKDLLSEAPGDQVTLTFHLVEGTVAELLESWKKQVGEEG